MDSKLEEILNISEKLFARNGIKSVSMDDIANEMGVSKKTIYKYIKDKHMLVKLTLESAMNRYRNNEVNCPKGENAIDEYLLVYKSVIEMIRQANFSVEYDLQKYYPDLHKIMLQARKMKMEKGLKSNLERGIEEGLYRQNLDVETITKINVHLSESMHDYEFLNENRDQLIKIMLVNFDYHMRGIVNENGLVEYLKLSNTIDNIINNEKA
jgi:TetR/AcrR family transcriptional regulator, cholesterol catabolism regulator